MKIKKQKSIKRKTVAFIGIFFVASIVFIVARTKAGTMQNVTGWLWGGTEEVSDGNPANGFSGYETGIGWVSTNSSNCDTNNNGIIDASEFSANSACPPTGTSVAKDWGLNVLMIGTISGYIWSSNLGWISFNDGSIGGLPNDLNNCPDGNCHALSHGNGAFLTGWARIIGICDGNGNGNCTLNETNANAGGWYGWIKLSGIAQSGESYGVKIDSVGKLSGYAWSDELGYIKFDPPGGATAGIPSVDLSASAGNLLILASGEKLSDLTAAQRTKTLTWSTHGSISSCSASCSSGICDPTWNGNLSLTSPTSKNIVIPSNAQNGVYQIDCLDGAGNPVESKSLTISVGCYGNTCQASTSTCALNNSQFITAVDYATCMAIPNSTCSSNQDCQERSGSNWHETAL